MMLTRIEIARALALKMVFSLVRVTRMGLHDACRAAAKRHQVDSDWLYRQVTE